ncbi:hypothetical protein TRAPUB_7611, partial [Trametes pubescens]
TTPHKTAPIINSFSASLDPYVATVRAELRLTMLHKVVRARFDEFLDSFVPGEDPGDASFSGLFDKVPVKSTEAAMYGPLFDAINNAGILQKCTVVATEALPDASDKSGQKIDGGMYPTGSAPTASGRTDWSTIELSIECKVGDADDPFDDVIPNGHPFADKRRAVLGQILSYGVLVFERQHRTHHFSIIVFGGFVRIIRWDRAGAIFSEKFNYREEPGKLARFLWRFSRLSPVQKGHDPTATRVLPGTPDYALMERCASTRRLTDDYARKLFMTTLAKDYPWWRITVQDVGGARDFLVGKPTFVASGLVGRGTRGYVALDLSDPDHRFVFLKDCWRVLHERSETEGAILSYLNECGVKGIPSRLCDGDVGEQETVSQDIWKAKHEDEECRMKHHKHYRLVVKEVGVPLRRFENGKQLVSIFYDCVLAHESAYLKAGVIHRDISSGNLLMLPKKLPSGRLVYRGLLTDWELSKRVEQEGETPRHPDRTGTWQFMSVNALNNPHKPISIPDELESFFHSMLWFAIRWLPHNSDNVGKFMFQYFDAGCTENGKVYYCGTNKQATLDSATLRTNANIPLRFFNRPLPKRTSKGLPVHQDASGDPPSHPHKAPPPEVDMCEWSKEDLHPINAVFAGLLDWFGASYRLATLQETKQTSVPMQTPLNDDDADRLEEHLRLSAERSQTKKTELERLPPQDRAALEARAKKLESHRPMAEFLLAQILAPEVPWPQDGDKLPDQLPKNYNPDKEHKDPSEKTPAAASGVKRKALPEGSVSADSASKKTRSTPASMA